MIHEGKKLVSKLKISALWKTLLKRMKDKWQIWEKTFAKYAPDKGLVSKHMPDNGHVCCCCWVASVVSDSVQPYRRQPTRLPHPWASPGKNTAVGCHFLLQCRKVKSEREVAQSCLTLSDPMDCSLPGSSIHGIFQARVLPLSRAKTPTYSGYSWWQREGRT